MSKVVNFPSVPLVVSHDEDRLIGAFVKVCLHDKKHLYGKLLELNNAQQSLSIQNENSKDKEVILFSDLHWVSFPTALSEPAAPHPLTEHGSEVSFPDELLPYKLSYQTGEPVKGKTHGWLVDDYGLHLFPANEQGRATRLFVPLQALTQYRIGPLQIQIQTDEDITEHSFENLSLNTRDLEDALSQQRTQTINNIGELLVRGKLISQLQLDEALNRQRIEQDKKLGEILEEMGTITSDELHRALALQLGFPFARLANFDIDPGVLPYLSEELARGYSVIPLLRYKGRLVVAMHDPSNTEIMNLLRFTTNSQIEVVIATQEDINLAINQHYGAYEDNKMTEELKKVTNEIKKDHIPQQIEMERLAKEKPTVRLLDHILIDAIHRGASDIHIRPNISFVDLTLRIDGNLIKTKQFDKALLPAIISRIKILGHMDISERRIPQDGRTHFRSQGHVIDMRISVMPTVNGESAVIRILDKSKGLLSIDKLGFNQRDEEVLTDLLHKNNGIFLVTGPTGSGKSTTLYAALGEVIKQNVNIITVEDPVEYHVEGIEQIQVNTATGYTFAKSLRHILRHDPDVIMVGEIRDVETGKIAIESALTGHLVLSTLHTNSAAGTITRLLEMDIEPYLLQGTLLGVLAQRLVGKNCPHCIEEEVVDERVRRVLKVSGDEKFYRGIGCEHCNHIGYQGRMAVYELLLITEAMRNLIQDGIGLNEIQKQACHDGMIPLTDHALQVARDRKTSLSEVYRIRLI